MLFVLQQIAPSGLWLWETAGRWNEASWLRQFVLISYSRKLSAARKLNLIFQRAVIFCVLVKCKLLLFFFCKPFLLIGCSWECHVERFMSIEFNIFLNLIPLNIMHNSFNLFLHSLHPFFAACSALLTRCLCSLTNFLKFVKTRSRCFIFRTRLSRFYC